MLCCEHAKCTSMPGLCSSGVDLLQPTEPWHDRVCLGDSCDRVTDEARCCEAVDVVVGDGTGEGLAFHFS